MWSRTTWRFSTVAAYHLVLAQRSPSFLRSCTTWRLCTVAVPEWFSIIPNVRNIISCCSTNYYTYTGSVVIQSSKNTEIDGKMQTTIKWTTQCGGFICFFTSQYVAWLNLQYIGNHAQAHQDGSGFSIWWLWRLRTPARSPPSRRNSGEQHDGLTLDMRRPTDPEVKGRTTCVLRLYCLVSQDIYTFLLFLRPNRLIG